MYQTLDGLNILTISSLRKYLNIFLGIENDASNQNYNNKLKLVSRKNKGRQLQIIVKAVLSTLRNRELRFLMFLLCNCLKRFIVVSLFDCIAYS